MKKRIIISGGGIAGLTVANLLQKQGHQIIVVDKANEFTQAGFLLSLKSFGVKIMEELGLGQHLLDASLPSDYMNFLDADGNLIRSVSYQKMNEQINQSIRLITRGGLHQVLFNAIKDEVTILLNTTIELVEQTGQTVKVTLSNGQLVEADLLLVSEGLRSVTRKTYIVNSYLEEFNIFYMSGRLKEKHNYPVGTFKTFIDINKSLAIYPISPDELAIQCYIYNTDEVGTIQAKADQLLTETFKGYGSEVQQLIDRFLQNGLLFSDKMGMVHAPNLVDNQIVLLGDAGYCPTALSGMGASLSIYGAKALAHFISQSLDDISLACQQYNSLMQPIIEKFQRNARSNAETFLPKNEATLEAFTTFFSKSSEADLYQRMTAQLVLTDDQLHFIYQ
jgi:2-polyprenyl-6-methoxyphenol hydroxylase-like FAD-dependent oxidoreductase